MRSKIGLAVLVGLLVGCAGRPVPAAPEPDLGTGLGNFVDRCAPEITALDGSEPCLALGPDQRWVLIKDQRGESQFLVVARDQHLRLGHYDRPEPPMWSAAWAARVCVRDILAEFDHREVPLDRIGVAINSRFGGSQDRQHIHVDLIRENVVTLLRDGLDSFTLEGSRYKVIRRPKLDDKAIFALLEGDTDDQVPPYRRTLAIVADPKGGIDILLGSAGPEGHGSAEHDVLIETVKLDEAEHSRRNHCPNYAG
jgi:CDP-diacylglycerol pyrophosphatase